ncbi:myotubularin-related protein [Heterostelium album PN500]|uniref:Myotubularin-related protein n=1 Tax=Heterostelium pallidum (strain ATCC 26659 / Pp 5 / PN500) TaxID=670386 RepID=D3BK85_HETP5|nr:myotubularin-related protein [Heterostelium album PN500]EFA78315.1 myotubularin-related protein [Heterostelium album PN500]|eukprot:XP_020430440.1 myotubularin-related protein [Heterostelium album PN500]
MTIVGLVVQQHNGNILFQNVREYLSPEKANLASKAFLNQISAYDNAFITKGSTSHLSGSIVVMNMYRVYYMILNELFILAIAHANDNPYEGALYLARVKRLLLTAAKELNEVQLQKKYNEIYFGMERILFGEDGCDVLTQRLSEVAPHVMSAESAGGAVGGTSTQQSGQSSGNSVVNNLPSLPSLPSLSSSSAPQIGGVGVGGKILDALGAANTGIGGSSIPSDQYQKQLVQLSKFESVSLNDRILTVSSGGGSGGGANGSGDTTSQNKSARHIYDPPTITTKWGGKTGSTIATRVSNRVMFTLRHPNASMQNNNNNNNNQLQVSGGDQEPFRPESTTEDLDLPTTNNKNSNNNSSSNDGSSDSQPASATLDRKYTLSMPSTNKKPLNTPQTPDTSSSSLLSTSPTTTGSNHLDLKRSNLTSSNSSDGQSTDASTASIINDRSSSESKRMKRNLDTDLYPETKALREAKTNFPATIQIGIPTWTTADTIPIDMYLKWTWSQDPTSIGVSVPTGYDKKPDAYVKEVDGQSLLLTSSTNLNLRTIQIDYLVAHFKHHLIHVFTKVAKASHFFWRMMVSSYLGAPIRATDRSKIKTLLIITNDSFDNLCGQHRVELNILCNRCNETICAKCIYDPKHRDHFAETELIDHIGESIINEQNNVTKPNKPEENVVKQRLDLLWNLIKKQAATYQLTQDKVADVSTEFRKFHESLMLDEHKLKKSLVDAKDSNYQAVQVLLQEIQSFKTIDNLKFTCTPSALSASNCNIRDSLDSSSGGVAVGIRESYNSEDGISSSYDQSEDTTDRYDMESIIKSVNQSDSLEQFCKVHKSTLFYSGGQTAGMDQDEIQRLKQQEQFNMMKTIQRHFRIFNNEYINKLQDPTQYSLKIERPLLNKLMTKINDCIHLEKSVTTTTTNEQSNETNNGEGEGVEEFDYIFSVAEDGHCSIFDLQKMTIDIIPAVTVTKYTLQSVICARDNSVYIFDGHPNRYYRFNMTTQRIDKSEPITGISWAYSITTCYDGDKYIYLTGGQSTSSNISRVDRFNIETQQFEKLGSTGSKNFHALSFYHNDQVYIVANRDGKEHLLSLIAFNVKTHAVSIIIQDMGFHISTDCICFDGKELIYFVDYYNNFYCTSIVTKMKKLLDNPPNIKPFSMIYRKTLDHELDEVGYIYMEIVFLLRIKCCTTLKLNIQKEACTFSSLSSLLTPNSPRGGSGSGAASSSNNNNSASSSVIGQSGGSIQSHHSMMNQSKDGASTTTTHNAVQPHVLASSSSSSSFSMTMSNNSVSTAAAEEKLEKLRDITTKTIDNIIFKITEMKREKQFLQSFKEVMRIAESLVDIERMLETVDPEPYLASSSNQQPPQQQFTPRASTLMTQQQSSNNNPTEKTDSAAELIKIIHSKSNQSKRGSKITERSTNSIDSLHTVLQQCLDNIRQKILAIKKHLSFEQSTTIVLKYGEIIRNIRNQLNSIRTLSLPDNVMLCDGEKLLLKVECRYHLYDNISVQQLTNSNVNSYSGHSNNNNNKDKDISTNEEEYVIGTMFLTNFQIIFYGIHQNQHFKKSFSLHSITKMYKSGKKKSIGDFSYRLNFLCKDARTISLSFDKTTNALKDVRKCVDNIISNSLFCFVHRSEFTSPEVQNLGWNVYSPRDEYARMGVPSVDWKFSHSNTTYYLCDSYPSMIVVPESITDEHLKAVAQFRSKGRIPALSYRHWSNKTSITRCSQPRVGIGRNRCEEDEFMLNAIRLTSSSTPVNSTSPDRVKQSGDKTLYIIDARPYANAVGNRAKGAGWEIMTNYPNCEIEFMDIANIHVMRNSLLKLRDAVESSINKESQWFANLESSGWFQHMKLIMAGAVRVAKLIHIQHSNVLVHCSDGWDRTSQLVGLAEILLDPYYRTIRGFQVLIEKEWLSFGHKFAHRCGQVYGKDEDERSPVFIQFLEAVYQIINQFPSKFEFNSHFLRLIYVATYSGKYGNFLYNTERERLSACSKTISLWLDIDQVIADCINPLYQGSDEKDVLFPDCSIKKMKIWKQIYFPLSETEYYESEEKLIRNALEKLIEERAAQFIRQHPLIPYRAHTASISLRRPTMSQQQMVISSNSSGSSQSQMDLRENENNFVNDQKLNVPTATTKSSLSSSPSSPSSSSSPSKSVSSDIKKTSSPNNGFNSLSRSFFRKKENSKK